MFVLQNKYGKLFIMNGGSIKGLERQDIDYYFQNMENVIAYMQPSLTKYGEYQKQIADDIKSIGGYGTIHGAIIDIDWFNHIYVNPIDGKLTAYWARDIKFKKVYSDIPTLLHSEHPELYAKYLYLIKGKSTSNETTFKKASLVEAPKLYLETDIYVASREIKKMQKVNDKILSIWIEQDIKK